MNSAVRVGLLNKMQYVTHSCMIRACTVDLKEQRGKVATFTITDVAVSKHALGNLIHAVSEYDSNILEVHLSHDYIVVKYNTGDDTTYMAVTTGISLLGISPVLHVVKNKDDNITKMLKSIERTINDA